MYIEIIIFSVAVVGGFAHLLSERMIAILCAGFVLFLVALITVFAAMSIVDRKIKVAALSRSHLSEFPELSHHFHDVTYQDLIGSNLLKRILWTTTIWILIILYSLSKNHETPQLIFWVLYISITVWLSTYTISRITFQKEGILFESSTYHLWKIGRHFYVPNSELNFRNSTLGDAIFFCRNGKRFYSARKHQWNPYTSMTGMRTEIAKRFPPARHDFLEEDLLHSNHGTA